jgi:hypothetical protein
MEQVQKQLWCGKADTEEGHVQYNEPCVYLVLMQRRLRANPSGNGLLRYLGPLRLTNGK